MSTLTKDDLIALKEQFKSVHNVLPSRFLDEDDLQAKPTNKDEIEQKGNSDKSRQASIANEKDASTMKNSKKQVSQFQLPGANSSVNRKNLVGRVNDDHEDTSSNRIQSSQNGLASIKKYHYTKNSLNCIPLTSKIRQYFIRFVEWKHQSNLILVFVTINSIILGLVDYRFKGKYTDPLAPMGNYILGITEPIFAVLFTAEALVKIVAQGFILSKKTYLRDSWNALDFIVVITALMSFSPDISSVSILRAFRLFKPLRNLQVFPSMRLLMRTLISSANRLKYLVIFYFSVIVMFAIIGVNLMQGVTTYRCRQTPQPVNGDWLPVESDHRTCGWSHKCEIACGSLFYPRVMVNGTMITFKLNITSVDRDSNLKELFYGYASFNNLLMGVQTLFQISTLQNWYKIMYMLQDSYNSYISGIYFVIYLLISNYFIHILTIGIIMQRFIEYNDHSQRQQIFHEIMGMEEGSEPINIEDLKNKIREDEIMNAEVSRVKKKRRLKDQIAKFYNNIVQFKAEPIPKRSYYKRALPRICWKITQNIVYELCLAITALINALTLASLKYPETNSSQITINVINIVVTLFFAFDMFVRLIAQGFGKYFTNYENLLYTAATIGAMAQIIMTGWSASPISGLMVLKIYKILMRSNYFVTFNQLIDSIIFTLSVVLSYCAIMVIFVYIFSLLGMQFFAGQLKFASDGTFDPKNGEVPRQNFDTILWSTTTVLQTLIGDDWSLVMFNCMLATGWYACFYFVTLILFGYIILMNLFQAILIGNFEESSVIMRDAKVLKSLQKAADDPDSSSDIDMNKSQYIQRKASILLRKQPSIKNNAYIEQSQHNPPQITIDALNRISQEINIKSTLKQTQEAPLQQKKSGRNNQVGVEPIQTDQSLKQNTSKCKEQDDSNDLSVVLSSDEETTKKQQAKQGFSVSSQKNQTLKKQNVKQLTHGTTGIVTQNFRQESEPQTDQVKPNPILDYIKNSSCFLFHKKSRLREMIYKVVIDPDIETIDSIKKKVEFDTLTIETQEELLNQGFNEKQQYLHRESTFLTIKYFAKDTNTNQVSIFLIKITEIQKFDNTIKTQKSMNQKYKIPIYQLLNQLFTYFILIVIMINIIFLLIKSPANDPKSSSNSIIERLDIMCTIIFIVEALLKVIALGFVNTSIDKKLPYIYDLWNLADFCIILLALIDLNGYHQPRYDGLMNSFKVLKIFHILKLMKKNDLMVIIQNTMIRSIKPIIVALVLSFTFIFIYGIIGVSIFRGKYFYCQQLWTHPRIDVKVSKTKFDCYNWGGTWVNFERNFDNILIAMLTLFEMMSSEDWLSTAYMGIDIVGIDMQPKKNHSQLMLLYFLPFMIIGHIFLWRIFGGVIIENFNRTRDKFYDYALMTSEQRNWVEMQRFLIEKRLKVKIDDQTSLIGNICKNIVNSNNFDYFILSCIMINTTLQAISYFGNPTELDQIQLIASYIFAGIFNLECVLKLVGFGKYYFWESHNIFDFSLIIGTDVGILLSAAFPNFSIGPLAALLRAFRIGRILRLLKEKKSLKILIDTIFYIFPILINIVVYMFLIIMTYSVVGMYLFGKVIHQVEINQNANFESFGGALLLLFRCTTGEKWNLLMREYTFTGDYKGQMCLNDQSYESYLKDGPLLCGTQIAYVFFLSYVVIMQLMVVNLFIAVVLEGFAQFSIQNNSVVSSQDYEQLIELWSHYDPTATGWIKPKHLAFLMYELPAPLGKADKYKEILKQTLDHNTMIKQYSDKKAINMKTKFIYNDEKGLILPHSTVMKLLVELSLPVYNFEGDSVVHFKDVCLTITKRAIQESLDTKNKQEEYTNDVNQNQNNYIEQLFDKIPEEQQKKLNEVWKAKYKNLMKAQLIEDYDTGKLWAGLYILKMIRSVNNGFGRSQFKKKLAQNRLFKQLQQKNAGIRRAKMNVAQLQNPQLINTNTNHLNFENSPFIKNDEFDQEAEDVVSGVGSNTKKQGSNLYGAINNLPPQVNFEQLAGSSEKLVGGPQKRGRSPLMKDQGRSTWWMQGEQRNHYIQWMQNNNIQLNTTTANNADMTQTIETSNSKGK